MKYLYILTFALLVNSCNDSAIYNSNVELEFLVNNSSSEYVDTLNITTTDNFISKLKMKFTTRIDEVLIVSKSIETLFTANENEIILKNPNGAYLNKTILTCPPYVKFPITKGQKYSYENSVTNKELNIKDVNLKSELEVIGYVDYLNKMLKEKTWEIHCKNKSELGSYNSKFYFNEKYGFVYFEYIFDDYTVNINLHNITTRSKE